MNATQKERLFELLTDQTIFGLVGSERMELEQLKKDFPDWEKDISLELAAAAIGLSNLEATDALPANLRTKIFASADDFFAVSESSQKVLNFPPKSVGSSTGETASNVSEVESKPAFWQWLGWAVAAAACIALVINIWLTHSQKQPEISESPKVIQPAPEDSSAAKKREQLLASAKDVVQISLASAKNEKEILGDVVWSNQEQKGYARFRGLPANDAATESYQLWIVDETQDTKTPISGGVFNVSDTGEIIVPINAELNVKKPKAVAVSKEKSGGVVVTKPERIVAIAKI